MVNLNKQRIAVYLYFLIVFTLIFGLSFQVEGNKITGSFVLETAGNFMENLNLFVLILFGFLMCMVFSLFAVRYTQEVKKEIPHEYIKFYTSSIIVLLIIIFLIFWRLFWG